MPARYEAANTPQKGSELKGFDKTRRECGPGDLCSGGGVGRHEHHGHVCQILAVQLLGLRPFLDIRIASCHYGFRKPDVRLFKMALAALDAQPSEAVYIGDHPYRYICGAQAAGIHAVLIQRKGRASGDTRACIADTVVRALDELTAWLLD